MTGRRKSGSPLPPRMYEYKGKRTTTYYYITPGNERINLGHDLAVAKRKWLELEEGKPVAGSVSELIDRYLAEVAPKKAPRTYKDNLGEAERLRDVFGKMHPCDVRPVHIAKYLDLRGATAPVRANREKALLSHIFTQAMRWGIIDTNPCKGVARNTERPRDRYVTDDEFYAFLAFSEAHSAAGVMLAATARLAYLTGQRRQDILSMSLNQITQDGIMVVQAKTGTKVLIGWTDTLEDAVRKAKAIERPIRSMRLICTKNGQQYTDSGFKAMWNRLQVAWAEAGNERFHFHDLRAKATTDMIEDGRRARDLTGHASDAMINKTYDRRSIKRAKAVR